MCIRESYYHQAVWCILPIVMCLKHQVELQEGCPNCIEHLNMGMFMSRKCNNCGFLFARTTEKPSNFLNLFQYQLALHDSFYGGASIIPQMRSFEEYIRLAHASLILLSGGEDHVGTTIHPLEVFHNRAHGKRNSLNYAIAFANVLWTYSEFPHNFNKVLDKFLQRNKKYDRYWKLKRFESVCTYDEFLWVKDAYQQFFLNELELGNVRKDCSVFKDDPILLLKRRAVRREEVKVNTRMTYQKIFQLERRSHLIIHQYLKGGQKVYSVDNKSLDSYLSLQSSLLSKKEASVLVGLHVSTVSKLIESGCIEVREDRIGNKCIDHVTMDQFILNCKGELVSEIPEGALSFHEVVAKYNAQGFGAIQIIQFTLTGHLHPVKICQDKKITSNYYLPHEILQCLTFYKKVQTTARGASFTDVMKLLQVGEWTTIKKYNIEPDFTLIMKDGRKRYFFKDETINRITSIINAQ